MKNNQLIIFDTTLRDGEQSPGAAMTKEEKIRIARQLEKLGVNVIEAGFAAASQGDFDSIYAISDIIKNLPYAPWRAPVRMMCVVREKPLSQLCYIMKRMAVFIRLLPLRRFIWKTNCV